MDPASVIPGAPAPSAGPPGQTAPGGVDLLIVTPLFWPCTGGVQTHVAETARRLRERGLDVRVVTADPSHDLDERDEVGGVPVERARAHPRSSDAGLAPGVVRRIVQARPGLVHVQGVHPFVCPLAMATAALLRVPYVVTFHSGGHSSGWRNHVRRHQWRLLRPLLRRASRLVAVSEFERLTFASALGLPAERIDVIPNGVTPPPAEPGNPAGVPPRRGATSGALRCVSVGRLERYKGHHHVIDAWRDVVDRWPGSELVVVGSGPAEPALREQARAAGVPGITFASFPPDDRAGYAALLARADVALLLSEYESQGIAVMEALAAGTRCVVRDATALREYVARGWAEGVHDPGRPGEIVEAIARALDRPAPEVDLPTWDACTAQLQRLYADLHPRHRRPPAADRQLEGARA